MAEQGECEDREMGRCGQCVEEAILAVRYHARLVDALRAFQIAMRSGEGAIPELLGLINVLRVVDKLLAELDREAAK